MDFVYEELGPVTRRKRKKIIKPGNDVINVLGAFSSPKLIWCLRHHESVQLGEMHHGSEDINSSIVVPEDISSILSYDVSIARRVFRVWFESRETVVIDSVMLSTYFEVGIFLFPISILLNIILTTFIPNVKDFGSSLTSIDSLVCYLDSNPVFTETVIVNVIFEAFRTSTNESMVERHYLLLRALDIKQRKWLKVREKKICDGIFQSFLNDSFLAKATSKNLVEILIFLDKNIPGTTLYLKDFVKPFFQFFDLTSIKQTSTFHTNMFCLHWFLLLNNHTHSHVKDRGSFRSNLADSLLEHMTMQHRITSSWICSHTALCTVAVRLGLQLEEIERKLNNDGALDNTVFRLESKKDAPPEFSDDEWFSEEDSVRECENMVIRAISSSFDDESLRSRVIGVLNYFGIHNFAVFIVFFDGFVDEYAKLIFLSFFFEANAEESITKLPNFVKVLRFLFSLVNRKDYLYNKWIGRCLCSLHTLQLRVSELIKEGKNKEIVLIMLSSLSELDRYVPSSTASFFINDVIGIFTTNKRWDLKRLSKNKRIDWKMIRNGVFALDDDNEWFSSYSDVETVILDSLMLVNPRQRLTMLEAMPITSEVFKSIHGLRVALNPEYSPLRELLAAPESVKTEIFYWLFVINSQSKAELCSFSPAELLGFVAFVIQHIEDINHRFLYVFPHDEEAEKEEKEERDYTLDSFKDDVLQAAISVSLKLHVWCGVDISTLYDALGHSPLVSVLFTAITIDEPKFINADFPFGGATTAEDITDDMIISNDFSAKLKDRDLEEMLEDEEFRAEFEAIGEEDTGAGFTFSEKLKQLEAKAGEMYCETDAQLSDASELILQLCRHPSMWPSLFTFLGGVETTFLYALLRYLVRINDAFAIALVRIICATIDVKIPAVSPSAPFLDNTCILLMPINSFDHVIDFGNDDLVISDKLCTAVCDLSVETTASCRILHTFETAEELLDCIMDWYRKMREPRERCVLAVIAASLLAHIPSSVFSVVFYSGKTAIIDGEGRLNLLDLLCETIQSCVSRKHTADHTVALIHCMLYVNVGRTIDFGDAAVDNRFGKTELTVCTINKVLLSLFMNCTQQSEAVGDFLVSTHRHVLHSIESYFGGCTNYENSYYDLVRMMQARGNSSMQDFDISIEMALICFNSLKANLVHLLEPALLCVQDAFDTCVLLESAEMHASSVVRLLSFVTRILRNSKTRSLEFVQSFAKNVLRELLFVDVSLGIDEHHKTIIFTYNHMVEVVMAHELTDLYVPAFRIMCYLISQFMSSM
ncbi:hypothetical protein PCE1_002127 [Barthelona sp. PCE]